MVETTFLSSVVLFYINGDSFFILGSGMHLELENTLQMTDGSGLMSQQKCKLIFLIKNITSV